MQLHLQKYGTKLKVRNKLFEVSYTDENDCLKKEQFAPHTIDNIWIQKGTLITSAAIFLALKHKVDIIWQDGIGQPKGRLQSCTPTNTSVVLRGQLLANQSQVGIAWAKKWVVRKLMNQQEFLIKLQNQRSSKVQDKIKKSILKNERLMGMLQKLEHKDVHILASKIRGLEGSASRIYFRTISSILPNQYKFDKRSMQPALDIFNAFLNYAYGILYVHIETALIAAGISPFIGFMHRDEHQHKSMVFDFIESYRIWADKSVVHLATRKIIRQYHVQTKGKGFWLNKEGKQLLVHAFNEQFEKKKLFFKNKKTSPRNVLRLEALELAQQLKKMI